MQIATIDDNIINYEISYNSLLEKLPDNLLSDSNTNYPRPEWLPINNLNYGIAGDSGVGKSSLINNFRNKKPNTPGAAKVGINQTTVEPTPYSLDIIKLTKADAPILWDLPGCGTTEHP